MDIVRASAGARFLVFEHSADTRTRRTKQPANHLLETQATCCSIQVLGTNRFLQPAGKKKEEASNRKIHNCTDCDETHTTPPGLIISKGRLLPTTKERAEKFKRRGWHHTISFGENEKSLDEMLSATTNETRRLPGEWRRGKQRVLKIGPRGKWCSSYSRRTPSCSFASSNTDRKVGYIQYQLLLAWAPLSGLVSAVE